MKIQSTLFLVGGALLAVACGGNPGVGPEAAPVTASAAKVTASAAKVAVPKAIQAIVDAPDRSDADRALDGGRHPAEMLAFFGIAPGMKVAELGAGGGYTAELLARAVGPTGVVYGQNNKFVLERFAEKLVVLKPV